MIMNEYQLKHIKRQLRRLLAVPDGFYAKRLAGLDPESIKSQADFEQLPFTDKGDLRQAYPLGLAAVPMERVVRIHSSSGTTGTPARTWTTGRRCSRGAMR